MPLLSVPRLSVLDQSPVPAGSTAAQALQNSISLARHVDALGYHRFWMSEHHAMETLACTAPEIMLSRIGAETIRIRIGSGGIMLPHYTPLKVAETFATLEALYPGRVDLGLGRAPGGGPLESAALRRVRTGNPPDDFPDQLSELIAFLHHGFPPSHPFSRVRLSPATPQAPALWLLGSSLWSAMAAAEYGLPYAFAHFFSPDPTREAFAIYRSRFQTSTDLGSLAIAVPYTAAAVGVLCAETQAEADRMYQTVRLLQLRIRQNDRRPLASPEDAAQELGPALATAPAIPETGEFPRYVVGTPDRVRAALDHMVRELSLDELIVNTIAYDHAARLRSYSLLAEAFSLSTSSGATIASAAA